MAIGRRLFRFLGFSCFLLQLLFLLQKFLLREAPLPAVFPVADKKMKTKGIDFHARLKADAKVSIVHLVLVHVGMKEIQVACNGEEKIIVIRRQF